MNRYRTLAATSALLFASVALVSGCSEEIHTAQWWMAHGAELQAKLEECKKYPSLNQSDANCKAANEAFATLISATKNPANAAEPADAH
jgi:uncharacterized protein (DUF2147 family)